jgi:hypothetical protein
MRQGVILTLVMFVGLLVAGSPASARPSVGNTWAGVWSSDFGPLTLDAGGSGSYTGFTPGTVSGAVVGNVDKGTWNQPGSPPKMGTFVFTMGSDGQSFTGDWAYSTGGCGSSCGWNGTCQSGECLKNGQVATTTTTAPPPRVCSGRVVQGAANLKEVRVVAVQPDVAYHCEGEPSTVWHEVERDTVLHQGDEISCDPDGSVTLAFADNSTVVVQNTTQLKIASFFAEGGVVRTQILLKMGEIAAKVNKSEATKSDFRIKEPTGVASVRGTVFSVFYDPGSNTSITSVTRGVVTVDPAKPGLVTAEVPAGKEVEVTGRAITPLAPIGKAGARGGVGLVKARALVLGVIARENGPCALTMPRTGAFSVNPSGNGWLVSIKATGGKAKGWSKWTVTAGKVRPANLTARTIAAGCR